MVPLTVYKTRTNREKIIGLIGKNNPYALLLQTRFGIHTFGVKFPIDVVILNNKHVVTTLYEHMQPNRIFVWNPRYSLVLELPPGTILKEKITTGTKIKLVVQ